MLTALTPEQTEILIQKGISEKYATTKIPIDAPYRTSGIILVPCFTIGDLFSIIPKEIRPFEDKDEYSLRIDMSNDGVEASYVELSSGDGYAYCLEHELIDALFAIICYLLDHKKMQPME